MFVMVLGTFDPQTSAGASRRTQDFPVLPSEAPLVQHQKTFVFAFQRTTAGTFMTKAAAESSRHQRLKIPTDDPNSIDVFLHVAPQSLENNSHPLIEFA